MKLAEIMWKDLINSISNNYFVNNGQYYSFIAKWINDNKNFFGNEIMKIYSLEILISLDPEEYILVNSSFKLEETIKHLSILMPKKIKTLAMLLRDMLWNMVTIRVNEKCPNCGGMDVRLVKKRYKKDSIEKLFLRCESCVWEKSLYGEVHNEGEYEYLPANQGDLIKFSNVQ